MPDITAGPARQAGYLVEFLDRARPPKFIPAHHVSLDADRYPGMLVFADEQSRMVCLIAAGEILSVVRQDPPEPGCCCAADPAGPPGSPGEPVTATVTGSSYPVTVSVTGFAGSERQLVTELYNALQSEALRHAGRNFSGGNGPAR